MITKEREILNQWLETNECPTIQKRIQQISDIMLFPCLIIENKKEIDLRKEKINHRSILFLQDEDQENEERQKEEEHILKQEGFEFVALTKDDKRVWFYLTK
jgi:hypothetical protein